MKGNTEHNPKKMPGFTCKQCGNCCKELSGHIFCVNQQDYERWDENCEYDILDRISILSDKTDKDCEGNPGIFMADGFLSPITGEDDVKRCPYLRKLPNKNKYKCMIHYTKPLHCREYPHSKEHAKITKCMGFKKRDDQKTAPI